MIFYPKEEQKHAFTFIFELFEVSLHLRYSAPALPLAHPVRERKVRAAKDTPLLKLEAVGDGRVLQKKTTAPKGKGEKVV